MELSDELLEQIGAYLAGKLSADEKERFVARLRQDAALQAEVAIQRELKEGLTFLAQKDRFRHMHTDLAARGLLPDIDRQRPLHSGPLPVEPRSMPLPAQRPAIQFGRASWVMAASVVLLLGIGWVVYETKVKKTPQLAQQEQMFNLFFSAQLKPMPTDVADPDRLAAAPADSQSAADSVRLREAVDALQQANSSLAIEKLRLMAAGRPGHWQASAQWYLALAYIRTNQPGKALPLLRTIGGLKGHPYQAEARQLRDRLRAVSGASQP